MFGISFRTETSSISLPQRFKFFINSRFPALVRIRIKSSVRGFAIYLNLFLIFILREIGNGLDWRVFGVDWEGGEGF